MLDFLERRLKNEKGAMDKILVTLLLIIVGLGTVVALNIWVGEETTAVKEATSTKIESVTSDSSSKD